MLLLAAVHAALAGPSEVFGLGGRSIGRGGASVAAPDAVEAALYNPAALAAVPHPVFAVGYGLVRAEFDDVPPVAWDTNQDGLVDEHDDPLVIDVDPRPGDGTTIAFSRPLGKRFGLGLVAFLPKDRLILISSHEPSLPSYLMYEGRLNRFEAAAGLGGEVWRGLRVGAGAQMLAKARVHLGMTLDLAVTGAEEGDQDMSSLIAGTTMDVHDITLDVVPAVVPVAAVQWELGELTEALAGITLGARWRGASGLPVDVDVDLQANVTAQDIGELDPLTIALVLPVVLGYTDHYIPSQMVFGAALRVRELGRVQVDVERTAWSAMIPSIANVIEGEIQSPLFSLEDPSISDGNAYELLLEDTWGTRFGLDAWLLDRELDGKLAFVALTLRAGGGYQPSPMVRQGAATAFLDSDRLLFAGGLGLEHGDPTGLVPGPVAWDVFFQGHLLADGELAVAEARAGAPADGAPIPVGGSLWTAGLQWSFEY